MWVFRVFIGTLLVAWGGSALAMEQCQCNVSVISGAVGMTLTSGADRGPCGRQMSAGKAVALRASARAGAAAALNSLISAPEVVAAATSTFNASVDNDFFTPTPLTISVGDTVKWTWAAGTHTVTSVAGSLESYDSGFLSSGTFSHTFTHAGNYTYYCQLHGFDNGNGTAVGMFATIKVNAVPEPVLGLLAIPAAALALGRRRRAENSKHPH